MDTTNTLEHEISADTNTMVDHKTETTTNPADEISVDAFQSLRVSETKKKKKKKTINVEKKKIKVGINGIGLTGSSLAKLMLDENIVDLVAINDPIPTSRSDTISFLSNNWNYSFEGDENFENSNFRVHNNGNSIYYGDKQVFIYCKRKPEEIPWETLGVEIVIECTGLLSSKDKAAGHLKRGANKVIIADTSVDAPLFIIGVNDHLYTPDLNVISAGSSTTNAIAPLLKVINDRFGIVEGFVTTIHQVTAVQRNIESAGPMEPVEYPGYLHPIVLAAIDEPEYITLHDIATRLKSRVSRSCAAKEVGKVIPSLNGKLEGTAIRVSAFVESIAEMTLKIQIPATYEELQNAIREESEGNMKEILGYLDTHFDTEDVRSDRRSCIFYAHAGQCQTDTFVKVVAGYDDHLGYLCRVMDLIQTIST